MFFPVYILFRCRLMGAGDGKVIMLTAGSLGFYEGTLAIFYGFCLAALWSAIRILREKTFAARLFRLYALAGQIFHPGTDGQNEKAQLLSSQNTIPLAACLAGGSILYMLTAAVIS